MQLTYAMERINSKSWFDDINATINNIKDDVTSKLLHTLVQRRVTEIPTKIFDRGKEMLHAEFISQPAMKVCIYDEILPEKPMQYIPQETDRWIKQHGKWFDPYFDDKAKVNKLVNQLTMQSDSGANRIVTDDLSLLDNVTFIHNYPMSGCNKEDVAIICTAKGQLTLHSDNGNTLKVTCYYSKDVDGTIVSPTAIIRQHHHRFSSFIQFSDCDSNTGNIKLVSREGCKNFNLKLQCKNDLWYHTDPSATTEHKAKINRISSAAMYELWHQRTAHAGITTLQYLSQHAKGVPALKGNPFHKCPSCMQGKLCTKRHISSRKRLPSKSVIKSEHTTEEIIEHVPGEPGQHYHMDFGFIRGKHDSYDISSQRTNRSSGNIVTSIDGYKCYLIIVDRVTRFTWIFLAKSKHPPIETVRQLLEKFKSDNPNRTVRTDQGGELGHSSKFSTMIAECGFSLEETGPDASAQNGLAERPNRTFGQMMRCMLHSSELGPEFWSYALLHAVYIKNRLYHHSIKSTPYQQMTGNQPDLTELRIFGCRIFAKLTGKRRTKLDHHTAKGIFLGYTASNKIMRYIDEKTGVIKTATHAIFDEACMTLPSNKTPISARTLQILGYDINPIISPDIDNNILHIQKLNKHALLPKRGTPQSVGYDVFSNLVETINVLPGNIAIIPTGIAVEPPKGTYVKVAPRSGLTVKKNLTTMAGIIDPDYRGEVKVVIRNFGLETQTITPNMKIAQLIVEKVATPDIKVSTTLTNTSRGDKGFGSTDKSTLKTSQEDISDIAVYNNTTAAAATAKVQKLSIIPAYYTHKQHLYLSTNPYDHITDRIIKCRHTDNDPLLGMQLEHCTIRNLPQLKDCQRGSSSIRIPLWRSQLRNAYITHINGIAIYSITQIESIIKQLRELDHTCEIEFTFATIERQDMHPQFGVPNLYHDQMNIIAKHLWEMNHKPQWTKHFDEEVISPYVLAQDERKIKSKYSKHATLTKQGAKMRINVTKAPKKLTRRYLLRQDDWDDWKNSEFKQLDQYRAQNTLGLPTKLPPGANLLPLLWTYLIKDDGTKKARCVCNGSPRMRGSVTLANTYAGSLEQTGGRIFWALTAINNFITIGADASNAFAEAPAPKAPLYVAIDQPYRDWYKTRYPNKPALPRDAVLPVHGALQGHPEAARLWAKLIDRIIKNLGLKATTHEPCLYSTDNYNNTGKRVLFLRQVDDFAVSCEDKETALHVIKSINDKMTINVKQLGQVTRFNGVDVLQSKHYVKLYNKTYIEKIAARHDWILREPPLTQQQPVPMHSTPDYLRKIEDTAPCTESERKILEKQFGFTYRQGIGELIYAMVTCRPDISYSVIKLSQYSTRPAQIHFEAIKQIYKYLWQTKERGIIYWRRNERKDLDSHPIPVIKDDNYDYRESKEREVNNPKTMNVAVDSDYAGDHSHRRSITGLSIQLGGGTVLYKTRFQDTIALSSTEAEFTAAAEAGKFILHVRSILHELGVEQHHATTLYEDNQGAILMANAQQPTKRTRHMAIKTFAIQEWCERDLIILHKINTKHNWSDALTKPQSRLLFYRHMNHIMGYISPKYSFEMLRIDSQIMRTIPCLKHELEKNHPRLEHEIEGGCDNTVSIPT